MIDSVFQKKAANINSNWIDDKVKFKLLIGITAEATVSPLRGSDILDFDISVKGCIYRVVIALIADLSCKAVLNIVTDQYYATNKCAEFYF